MIDNQLRKLPINTYPVNDKFQIEKCNIQITKSNFNCQFSLLTNFEVPKHLQKFYKKRFFLFKKFSEGIILDEESWYSVIPEDMSAHISEKLRTAHPLSEVVDGFCGSGGLAIQLAMRFKKVTCIDIDPIKIQNINNNLRVYGQTANVQCMDFLKYIHKGPEPILVMCPPWGGLGYSKNTYNLHSMKPSFEILLEKALQMTRRIVIQLPKNIDLVELVKVFNNVVEKLRIPSTTIEIEQLLINEQINQLIIYYGIF